VRRFYDQVQRIRKVCQCTGSLPEDGMPLQYAGALSRFRAVPYVFAVLSVPLQTYVSEWGLVPEQLNFLHACCRTRVHTSFVNVRRFSFFEG